jgi:hypothetical protein
MNHCAIARDNEGNPQWSREYLDACYAAFVDGYAEDIMRLPSLDARRRAVAALPDKFRKRVEARILEKWSKR